MTPRPDPGLTDEMVIPPTKPPKPDLYQRMYALAVLAMCAGFVIGWFFRGWMP